MGCRAYLSDYRDEVSGELVFEGRMNLGAISLNLPMIFMNMLKNMESQAIKILNEVDRDNSNSNTRYNATKRTEIAKSFSKELYQKLFLSVDELQAMKDGYIYVHDLSDMIMK